MDIDDYKLIELCLEGNHLAQRRLYDSYNRVLYGICLRYASHAEEAQDILQDGFIKIFSKLDTYKREGSFEGWMKRIIIHTAIEYYRKKKDISTLDDVQLGLEYAISDEKNLEVEEILKLIQEMPQGYRMVFNLYAIEGYSHAEIAKKMNISEGTSKSQYARAKTYLQTKIQKINRIKPSLIQPILVFIRLIM